MNSEGLVQQPVTCRPLHIDKNNTHWKKVLFKKRKLKVHWQKFQKYDYYIFQLKWSLCQRTERWGRGQDDDNRVEWGVGQPWLASLGGAALLPDWAQEEVLRCEAAAWHPEDHSREALSGHSPIPSPLQLTHRLTDWPAGVRDSRRRRSDASKQNKAKQFGVTVIFT